MARFDFDSIFGSEPDWSKINLTDNPPCKECEHRYTYDPPGMTEPDTSVCDHCIKRWNYISNCIMKLAWYEKKEKNSVNYRGAVRFE